MEIKKAPVIIVGSGIAGLLTALRLSDAGIASIVVTKTRLTENSSRLAQGGIAAVLPENQKDSLELHVKDTLLAGAGLAEESVTRSILSEGYPAIEDLIRFGVPFDRINGKLALTKEAAHTTKRILHAGGDATGRSIQDTLIHKVESDPYIEVLEECIALKLLVSDNHCYGVQAVSYRNPEDLKLMLLSGRHIVLATGGIGQLYAHTTNPSIATGDGVAMAYLAGAKIQDMEFVQFHPTAFWLDGSVKFLISETLRGEGGILRDKTGRAFAKDYHSDGELAPRDIVTRAISAQIRKDGRSFVTLDITHLPLETIEERFPNILQSCMQYGIDIRKDQIPVAPAAHYAMGGVMVDTSGKTTVNNLYAVGEAVSSGLHGANRLASNSLLECVVLARRVSTHIENMPSEVSSSEESFSEDGWTKPSSLLKDDELGRVDSWVHEDADSRKEQRRQGVYTEINDAAEQRIDEEYAPQGPKCQHALRYNNPDELIAGISTIRGLMWNSAGILRDADGLNYALIEIEHLKKFAEKEEFFNMVPLGVELRNILVTSRLICEVALQREESRGAHYRTDFPNSSSAACHSIQQVSRINSKSIPKGNESIVASR